MAKAACADGSSVHTGTTVVGPVEGSVLPGSNGFCFILGAQIMVQDGTMEIPNHQYQVTPPLFHSHSFSPTVFQQSFVTVQGLKMCLVGDSHSADPTEVDSAGSNGFVEVTL